MAVRTCYLCNEDPLVKKRYGRQGLAEGVDCPICFQPTCRYHLTTVRWRWRETGEVDATRICKACKREYAHRNWDALHRDWIT